MIDHDLEDVACIFNLSERTYCECLVNRATMMVYAPHLEPFGLAPLEANACATPVVAVAEGGVRETIVDGVNGLLVEDSSALPAAIERLWADQAYARQLGEQGAALVHERWSLSAAIDRIEDRLLAAAHVTSP